MTVYANTTLPEVEELVQGAKIAALHEECGALFVEMEAWEDKDGVIPFAFSPISTNTARRSCAWSTTTTPTRQPATTALWVSNLLAA